TKSTTPITNDFIASSVSFQGIRDSTAHILTDRSTSEPAATLQLGDHGFGHRAAAAVGGVGDVPRDALVERWTSGHRVSGMPPRIGVRRRSCRPRTLARAAWPLFGRKRFYDRIAAP